MSLIHATSAFIPGDTRTIMANVVSKISAAAERAAQIVKQEAQALAPVDTGELVSTIGIGEAIDNGRGVTVEVVATALHAAYVEFGTGMAGASSAGAGPGISYSLDWPGMPAQPFLRPAIDISRGRILEEFGR